MKSIVIGKVIDMSKYITSDNLNEVMEAIQAAKRTFIKRLTICCNAQ
ncbi:hypothetical protein HBE96_18695 [Clostridium sp. P21]|uniref:Uncharacterized protein n=1 Tax=Clostridium muellerianum TaxID=2716538 RepID=A0A7Y0EJI8_9CLOT|nr:hypothetical protein [Clostridium muellerianum]NMM64639.1 hypothetical protein [Clostridium muellerianum]